MFFNFSPEMCVCSVQQPLQKAGNSAVNMTLTIVWPFTYLQLPVALRVHVVSAPTTLSSGTLTRPLGSVLATGMGAARVTTTGLTPGTTAGHSVLNLQV